MSDQGFYRRPLPDALVPFASAEGRGLFREALAEGHLEGWFALAEQFHTQADPAFCGLGTLVVALNALGVDPGRLWKGPWRWYSEDLLDCCLPLDAVRASGITLDQFGCLARCNGAAVETRRADESSLEAFRADLRAAASSPDGPVLAVSYTRRALGQTGDGHFSPVAGLHEGRDLALVLDVARFKYPPHWVPVPLLWEAMGPRDPATGRSRGWVLLRRRAAGGAVLFHLSGAGRPWAEVMRRLAVDLPAALSAAKPRDALDVARAFVAAMPAETSAALEGLPASLDALDPEHRAQARSLLDELRATALHDLVRSALDGPSGRRSEASTMMMLALPDAAFVALDAEAREAIAALRRLDAMPPRVRAELEVLREQMAALGETFGEPPPPACCVSDAAREGSGRPADPQSPASSAGGTTT